MIRFSQLRSVCGGKILQLHKDRPVLDLIIDSRKALASEESLFFAITGLRHDGHSYIDNLYRTGLRQFVIERPVEVERFPLANFFLTESSADALQKLASAHRAQFTIPVVGITGSNGKTIIKEWLYQLLAPDFRVVKNPGSYNSQIGVPLSVWQMQSHHQLGIFEAGISKPQEMLNLQAIIKPTYGIFTNLGTAHDEGFISSAQKVQEKLLLFTQVKLLIYCYDHNAIREAIQASAIHSLSWGFTQGADIIIKKEQNGYIISWNGLSHFFEFPFHDVASIENCFHCVVWMLSNNYSFTTIQERISLLKTVPMRLELKQGVNNCQIIDDSYNNDLGGLRISLNFLSGIRKKKKTLILSDILQSGQREEELVSHIKELIIKSDVTHFIGVGKILNSHKHLFEGAAFQCTFFTNTESALADINWSSFQNEVVLIKGARSFHFEKIAVLLQRKVHGTRMEIDLNRIVHNLNFFKAKLKPGVKLMVMVKAFAYGSGSEEIATLLQYHRIDYLGVAYADEGVELRKNQITIPIMVMNTAEESYQSVIDNNLEPVIYSTKMLHSFIQFLGNRTCTVHLEIDTGMKRLGLESNDLNEALGILKEHPSIKVTSVFSHLAGADEAIHDDFTRQQIHHFENACANITNTLGVNPIKHILNSPGILRHSPYQMDMVRLGIGLYGINPTSEKFPQLLPAATLKTVISQLKVIKAGESIGYGRKGRAENEMKIATIAIGYADGFNRIFSRGIGSVLINGKRAKVVGNVCMDMTMVDITDIDAKEGDDVIIFGNDLSIHEVAAWANTIPYEILTNTSERVKRIFFTEGI